jgi:hypothetical protein
MEGRSFAGLGFHPDTTAVPLNNLLAQRKTNASARVFGLRV